MFVLCQRLQETIRFNMHVAHTTDQNNAIQISFSGFRLNRGAVYKTYMSYTHSSRAIFSKSQMYSVVDDRMQGHSSAHFTGGRSDSASSSLQDSAHHLQGAEDFEPAVPRRPAGDPSHFTCTVPYVLLMRHLVSCREHGLNLRSEPSQSQLPAPVIWKSLPAALRHCQTVLTFKNI